VDLSNKYATLCRICELKTASKSLAGSFFQAILNRLADWPALRFGRIAVHYSGRPNPKKTIEPLTT
jgi:hypothetical protein